MPQGITTEMVRQAWLRRPDLRAVWKTVGSIPTEGYWAGKSIYEWAQVQGRQEMPEIFAPETVKEEPKPTPEAPPKPAEAPVSPITPEVDVSDPTAGIDTTGWTEQMKDLYGMLNENLETLIQQGQMINPDIDIDQATLAGFLEQAQTEVEPYYSGLIEQSKQDLIRDLQYKQQQQLAAEREAEIGYGREVERVGEEAAEMGLAYSGRRMRTERELAEATQRGLETGRRQLAYETTGLGTAVERQVGTRALTGLRMPTIAETPRVLAGQRAWTYGQTQQPLYKLSEGVVGALEREREVAEQTRAAELESVYRGKRALEFYQ